MESVFEVIAEPNRRAILNLLVSSEQSVGEIERRLRMPQPTVSKHLRVLRDAGVDVAERNDGLMVSRLNGLHGTDVMTEPFPGFATDMQAQFMALMCVADGASMITETIFENRFMHVQELARLGAHITLSGQTALVEGVPVLKGAPVMATDLRASVSLVIAALAAEGETTVSRVYHLDRGFERLEEKLSNCGASVERISG